MGKELREKADSAHTLASMSVYACGLAGHVRSIAFQTMTPARSLLLYCRELLPRNNRLPLADSLDLRMGHAFGLGFDTCGTCSFARLPGRASHGLRTLGHQSGFSTITQ